jgi:mannose-6-phosphate isomerase-like protein (cupin superfamily)
VSLVGADAKSKDLTSPAPRSPIVHRATGAALYYIVAGTGAVTIDGRTEDKGPGSLVFEPYGLIHQWANPRGEPLTTVIFNLNPEGMGAVRLGAPAAGE